MRSTLTSLAARGAVATLTLGTLALAQAPCWESNIGNLIASGDEVLATVNLSFNFPVPGTSGTTNQITVSENGFIWLNGTNTTNDYTPTILELTTLDPRICVGWTDLSCDPLDDPANGVFANTGLANRVVITWIGNDQDFGATFNKVIMQATLSSDGSVIITHREVDQYLGTWAGIDFNMIVGLSEGNTAAGGAATIPPESDFSAGPVLGGMNPTIYEQFENPNANPADPRDLDSIPTLVFFPAAPSYNVAQQSCGPFADNVAYGTGCPATNRDGVFYELFDAGNPNDLGTSGFTGFRLGWTGAGYAITNSATWEAGFANPVVWDIPGPYGAGDDSLSNQTLPFTAAYGGVITSAIQVDSNGRVWLTGGNTSDYFEDIITFVADGPSVAPLWDDFDGTLAGTVYYDTFPAAGTIPARAVITWDGIAEYANAANTNTFQVQLLANGDIIVGYQQVTVADGLVGFSIGDGANAPLPIDITTAIPTSFPVNTVDTVSLALAAGQQPVLNTFVTAETRGLNGSNLGVLHLGLTSQNAPLDIIGMTGCTWLASADFTFPIIVNMGVGGTTLNLAGPPSVLGASLYLQSVVIVPMINPLQIVSSNGLELILGAY